MTELRALILDFETASACDLKKSGAWRYSEDPTTEVLSLKWGFPGHARSGIMPRRDGIAFPPELAEYLADETVMFTAHNAGFEKAHWRSVCVAQWGWPDVPDKRWHDTMAAAAMKAVPMELDMLCRVLGVDAQKDTDGSKLTKSLSKPDKAGYYDRSAATLQRVWEYNDADILSQGEVHTRLGFLPRSERNVWLLNQRINQRGFRLDMPLVRAAQAVVSKATGPLIAEFREITGGLNPTQGEKYLAWMAARDVRLPNLQKETVARTLGSSIDMSEDELADLDDPGSFKQAIPDDVKRSLYIRQLTGSASVKKLDAMEATVCANGRVRGTTVYHGATTGREVGRLLQPTNFPRGSNEVIGMDIDAKVAAIMSEDPEYVEMLLGQPAVETVVGSLRHCIVADPKRVLLAGDFAGVEARLVLALAGQHDKCDLLASGADVYVDMACDIFSFPKFDITDKALIGKFKHEHTEERQTGKNSVLGCGFQMGAAKFHIRYCPDKPLDFAQGVIDAYRQKWAPAVPKLWRGLEAAARKAVHEGTPHEAYGVEYRLEDGWLSARLPSGRKLWYFNPQPTRRHMPWSTPEEPDIRPGWSFQVLKMGRWVTRDAYGGQLTENVIQGLARDLLWHAGFICEKEGLPIVLTVYDEIVSEPECSRASEKMLQQIMEDRPAWAREIKAPISVETWLGDRYRK